MSAKLLDHAFASVRQKDRRRRRQRRALEIATAFASLSLLALPLWGSLLFPTATAWFIFLFALYWLHKGFRFALHAVIGYRRLRAAVRRDWRSEAAALPGFADLWHLVIIPTYKEPVEVLTATLDHLVRQDFPRERIAVVLAFEARDRGARDRWQRLNATYAGRFGHFWCTFHPDIAGEVKGKSSNEAWAARWAKELLCDRLGRPLANVIVTTCDADSHFYPSHLSAVAYHFLRDPYRHYKIFQPAILFYSNLWRLPLPHRSYTALQCIGHLARLVPKARLVSQSTYSLSLLSCHAVGYWDTDVIPEDSHMYFKMFFHLGEAVQVEPIFLPLWADAAEGRDFWTSYRNLYEQEKRWSWGVSDVPYVLEGLVRARHIPLRTRLGRCIPYIENHILWPGNWFLLSLGTRLPEQLASAHLLPHIRPIAQLTWGVLNLCALALVVAGVVHLILVAPAPGQGWRARALTLLGWTLIPIFSFFFLALPAAEAHLRLLLGRRLEYRVTEKLPPAHLPSPTEPQPAEAA